MVGTSKILTVSYGTFSCTLEGFDDSFDTMKAIAEYFRDLAADDRYFGAEPPTPDAEMLARIAEREISRRVEARMDATGNYLLRAATQDEDAAPVAAAAAVTGAATAAAVATPAKADQTDDAAETPAADTAEGAEAEADAESDVAAASQAEPEAAPQAAAPQTEADTPHAVAAPAQPLADTTEAQPVSVTAAVQALTRAPDAPAPEAASTPTDAVADADVLSDTTHQPYGYDDPVIEAEDSVYEDESAEAAETEENSVAAKLQRIRDVVAKGASETVPPAPAFSEDEHADDFLAQTARDIDAALEGDTGPEQTAAETLAAEASTEDDGSIAEAIAAPPLKLDPALFEDLSEAEADDTALIVDDLAEAEADAIELPEDEAETLALADFVDADEGDDAPRALDPALFAEDDAEEHVTLDTAEGVDADADVFEDSAEAIAETLADDSAEEATSGSFYDEDLDEDIAQADSAEAFEDLRADDAGDDDTFDVMPDAAAEATEVAEDTQEDETLADLVARESLEAAEEDPTVAATETGLLSDPEQDVEPVAPARPRARIIKVTKASFDRAVEDGTVEEVAEDDTGTDDETPTADSARPAETWPGSSLSDEEEEQLARELAEIEAEFSDETVADEETEVEPETSADAAWEAAADTESGYAEEYEEDYDDDVALSDPHGPRVLTGADLMEYDDADDDQPAAASLTGWDDEDEDEDADDDAWSGTAAARARGLEPLDEDELNREFEEARNRLGDDEDAPETDAAPRESGLAAQIRQLARKTVKMGSEGRAMLTTRPVEEEGSVSRLMNETSAQMAEPESNRRRNAIQHLRAAVAATKADKALNHGDGAGQDSTEAYRDDLAEVVRPRRPQSDAPTSVRPRTPAGRPAPLKLVAEQRIDVPQEPVQPRRVMDLVPDEDELNSDAESFADFAQDMGAVDLPELLEAAAAYMSFVEGREQFSRPQLMTKVRQVGNDDFSREDGLRHFGQLLRSGKIEKIDGGRFTVSDRIGFRPDDRAVG